MAIEVAGLLFCDRLHMETETGNLTLGGLFTRKWITVFPSPKQHIVLYSLLVGVPGEQGQILMECVELATAEVLLSAERTVEIGAHGKRSVAVFFEGFRFPRPGEYRFTLACRGSVIAQQVLPVLESL